MFELLPGLRWKESHLLICPQDDSHLNAEEVTLSYPTCGKMLSFRSHPNPYISQEDGFGDASPGGFALESRRLVIVRASAWKRPSSAHLPIPPPGTAKSTYVAADQFHRGFHSK